MEIEKYYDLKLYLHNNGYSKEIGWAEDVKVCNDPAYFIQETIWVILNSGMREQVARIIRKRIYKAISDGIEIKNVFKHEGKIKAIKEILLKGIMFYNEWLKSENKVNYLECMPYIGIITKYHLAKNLGLDVVKPDRHLIRIAKTYNTTPNELCKKISIQTGDRIGVVDIVLWRTANLRRI